MTLRKIIAVPQNRRALNEFWAESPILLFKSEDSNVYTEVILCKSMKPPALFKQMALYLFNKQLEN